MPHKIIGFSPLAPSEPALFLSTQKLGFFFDFKADYFRNTVLNIFWIVDYHQLP